MSTIITRAGKGSALTHTEVDSNFTNLDTDKAELAGATFTGAVITSASTTTGAGLRLPHGAAPTSPVNGDVWSATTGLFARINGTTRQYADLSGSTAYTGKITLFTATTAAASLVIPHGAAPTSPVNGDVWSTTSGMFMRVNGTTRQFADLDQAQTLTSKTLTTPTLTTPLCNGLRRAVTAQTGAYTATTSVSTILCNATTAAFTVTLPTAVGNSGQIYTIKKTDSSANAVTVGTTSSQTIDGAATFSLPSQWNFVVVTSDGANWMRIG